MSSGISYRLIVDLTTLNMKSFIALMALVAIAAADVSHLQHRSSGADQEAVVLRSESEVNPDGYNFVYETSNGIYGQAAAVLKPHGEDQALNVQGSNQHTDPEGNVFSITYTADENGYHPEGAHLPTPPPTQPIPDYIQRSIQYSAQEEARKPKTPAQFNRYQ